VKHIYFQVGGSTPRNYGRDATRKNVPGVAVRVEISKISEFPEKNSETRATATQERPGTVPAPAKRRRLADEHDEVGRNDGEQEQNPKRILLPPEKREPGLVRRDQSA